jgi:MIP family channel proteins
MGNLFKATVAEFIGTFVLVFVGMGAVAVTVANGFDVTVPALAHGLAVVGLAYTYGHLSGTHINPAVTVGLLVGGKIDVSRAGAYIVAQFLGGIVAAFLLAALTGTELMIDGNYGQTVGSLTAGSLVQAAIFEVVLTFFLVSAVYQTAVFGKAGNLAGVAIGFTLTVCILAGGPYTGASLNPARTLGPAMAAGDFSYVPLYFLGIFAGGALAGLLHAYVLTPDE